jgi:hypothetical protein
MLHVPPVITAADDNWAATAEFYALIPWADSTTTVRGTALGFTGKHLSSSALAGIWPGLE